MIAHYRSLSLLIRLSVCLIGWCLTGYWCASSHPCYVQGEESNDDELTSSGTMKYTPLPQSTSSRQGRGIFYSFKRDHCSHGLLMIDVLIKLGIGFDSACTMCSLTHQTPCGRVGPVVLRTLNCVT